MDQLELLLQVVKLTLLCSETPLTLSLALAIRIRLGLLLQCKLPPKRTKSLLAAC